VRLALPSLGVVLSSEPLLSFLLPLQDRNASHIEDSVKLAVHIAPLLKKTSPISIFSKETFWSDLLSRFPLTIDWVIDSLRSETPGADNHGGGTETFAEEQGRFFQTLESLRVASHRHRTMEHGFLADMLEVEAKAPVLYFLLTAADQKDVDWLYIMLSEMADRGCHNDAVVEHLVKKHGMDPVSSTGGDTHKPPGALAAAFGGLRARRGKKKWMIGHGGTASLMKSTAVASDDVEMAENSGRPRKSSQSMLPNFSHGRHAAKKGPQGEARGARTVATGSTKTPFSIDASSVDRKPPTSLTLCDSSESDDDP